MDPGEPYAFCTMWVEKLHARYLIPSLVFSSHACIVFGRRLFFFLYFIALRLVCSSFASWEIMARPLFVGGLVAIHTYISLCYVA